MLVEFHIVGNIGSAKIIEGDCMCSVAPQRDRGIGQTRLMQPLQLSVMIRQHMNLLKELGPYLGLSGVIMYSMPCC